MKKSIKALFVALSLLMFLPGGDLVAKPGHHKRVVKKVKKRTYTLHGTQTRGAAGRNGKLQSKKLHLKHPAKIVAVNGNNKGFWITNGRGAVIARFWRQNAPKAIGYKLKKGHYYVYPNLKNRQNRATVTLRIK